MLFRSPLRVALTATLSVAVVGALSFLFFATHLPAAHASPSQSVTITAYLNFTEAPQPPYGNFVASGVVCPSGGFTDDVHTISGDGGGVRNVLVRETYTCDDGSGTFTIQFVAHNTANPTGSTTWKVIGGTGAYATLHGTGTSTSVQTGPLTATVTETGSMHYN
jgi:hypothetical protein